MRYQLSKIISCQFCQVQEDGETVLGIGRLVLLSELPNDPSTHVCPNCRAKLESDDFVMVDLPWFPSEKVLSARSEF